MTLSDVLALLEADTVVSGPNHEVEVTGCFAADLMSDVLAFAREGSVLLTGLTTDQAIRTAAIKHLVAVIVVQDKLVSGDMMDAARDHAIALCRTAMSKYEACGVLMQAGLRPYREKSASSR